jgi:hypothetical protein
MVKEISERENSWFLVIKTELSLKEVFFHVVTYGLNSMGSHANQLCP